MEYTWKQGKVHRIPMNRSSGNDVRRTSGLTNRGGNTSDFSAKLPTGAMRFDDDDDAINFSTSSHFFGRISVK